MPLIAVKATERRFDDPATNQRLIAALTDAACQVLGEEVRSQIWVVLEGIPATRWGIGGQPLS
jgi:4-oxalocrotonate tautomerase